MEFFYNKNCGSDQEGLKLQHETKLKLIKQSKLTTQNIDLEKKHEINAQYVTCLLLAPSTREHWHLQCKLRHVSKWKLPEPAGLTYHQPNSFVMRGILMGKISELGWLTAFVTHDTG